MAPAQEYLIELLLIDRSSGWIAIPADFHGVGYILTPSKQYQIEVRLEFPVGARCRGKRPNWMLAFREAEQ